MNYKKILPLLISSAFLFAACGDDSSSTSADPSTEESSESQNSSSSKGDVKSSSSSKKDEAKSSSSKKDDTKSSSSKKDDAKSSSSKNDETESSSSKIDDTKSSSSSETDEAKSSSSSAVAESSSSVPNSSEATDNAPKLEDLEKNMELKLFDQTVYLSTGSKQGLMALRIPDELWIVTFTDFANGKVTFRDGNVGIQNANTDAANKIIENLASGFSIEFIFGEDDLILYSVNGSDTSEAVKASVAVQKGKVSKAEVIKNKIYECTDSDSTRIFTFYNSSYTYETLADNKGVNWHAGRYDIQRSTLLMLPLHNEGWSNSMFSYSVGTDSTIKLNNGAAINCTVKDVEDNYENDANLVDEWAAKKGGN